MTIIKKEGVLLIVMYGRANFHEGKISKGFTLNPYGQKLNPLYYLYIN
jgi:hypothetical protein